MKAVNLQFKGPSQVEIEKVSIVEIPENMVLVATQISAVSSGTEKLVFTGKVPKDMATDASIPALSKQNFNYPFHYGYSCVGTIIETGRKVDKDLEGKRVFAFHPHASHFLASPAELIFIPESINFDDCVFLASMETAVNLVLDGKPLIGEEVIAIGQGIIGLFVTALLSQFPLKNLTCIDLHTSRLQRSLDWGARSVFLSSEIPENLNADLVFELSGNPDGLQQALNCCGFDSRVIIGSWYGEKQVNMQLGGKFHRDRIRILSSQVSSISSEFTGRWDKPRRLQLALQMIQDLKPSRLISHRFHINSAQQAYEQLVDDPQDTFLIILEYTQSVSSNL